MFKSLLFSSSTTAAIKRGCPSQSTRLYIYFTTTSSSNSRLYIPTISRRDFSMGSRSETKRAIGKKILVACDGSFFPSLQLLSRGTRLTQENRNLECNAFCPMK